MDHGRSKAWRTCGRGAAALLFFLIPAQAWAFSFVDPSNYSQLTLPDDLKQMLAMTAGVTADHRPMQGADPLTDVGAGLDIGVEASIVNTSPDFPTVMEKYGISASGITFLPMGRVIVSKGIGPRSDLGLSLIAYAGYLVVGADFKVIILKAEEGPSLALRLAWATARINPVETTTWTPQILLSRRLDFADPYIGVGFHYITGTVSFPVTVGPVTKTLTGDTSTTAFVSFIGVGLRLGPTGVKLSMEGTYSGVEMHSISTKLSFQF